MNLAERGRVASLLVAAGGATALLALWPSSSTPAPTPPEPHVCPKVELPKRESCPPAVRAASRLDGNATVLCVAADIAQRPSYFVIGHYRTTEWWERIGVVARDGTELVPFVDRPSLERAPSTTIEYASAHLGEATTDLLVSTSTHLEIIRTRNGELTFSRTPKPEAPWSWDACRSGDASCRLEALETYRR